MKKTLLITFLMGLGVLALAQPAGNYGTMPGPSRKTGKPVR